MHRLLKTIIGVVLATQAAVYADNGYNTDFIDLVEIVYGDGYLSQGGSEMVEQMFEGIELKGTRILDLGCGVGGPVLHLIKNHDVTVVGADPEAFMIHQGQSALEWLCADTNKSIKGCAYFVAMKDPLTLEQFPDGSFDIVTSKEAILHVPHKHKLSYFQEIFRVLKKGGQLVILDWQHSTPNYSDDVRAMMEMDGVPFHLNTPEEYHQIVVQAGFSNVSINDWTSILAEQTLQDLTTIDSQQSQIVNRFDKATYDYARNSWNIQGRAFKNRELLVGLIKAIKK